ncbi:hypothetical protein [Microcoleus sp. D2_18a_D3]|uniref:hypothetical protein n=1 Tax=Microcoleus sp. D2_18a_D3 TaxID=3055330 RepID=UPI002FD1FCBA
MNGSIPSSRRKYTQPDASPATIVAPSVQQRNRRLGVSVFIDAYISLILRQNEDN